MKVKDLILTALFAALTAIGAFLGFKFVLASITLQFLFTAMAGVLLGRRYGALSQAVYVLLGLVGVPIFAQGGGFCHRHKWQAGAKGLFLLCGVAELTAFAQRTEQPAPGIERALFFVGGHAVPAAEKAQLLAAAAAFLGGV